MKVSCPIGQHKEAYVVEYVKVQGRGTEVIMGCRDCSCGWTRLATPAESFAKQIEQQMGCVGCEA